MRIFIACLAACAAFSAAAQAGAPAWIVDHDASALRFEGVQLGEPFEGSFESFNADIVFDPEDLEGSSIAVTVDMSSAATGDRQRDRALPGSDWFAVKEHPIAVFSSTKIARADDADCDFIAEGTLSMRDVARPVTLVFTLTIDGDKASATGGTTLVRNEFGVGRGDFETGEWVALEVAVRFDITADRQ